jgi:hypothetical protein
VQQPFHPVGHDHQGETSRGRGSRGRSSEIVTEQWVGSISGVGCWKYVQDDADGFQGNRCRNTEAET